MNTDLLEFYNHKSKKLSGKNHRFFSDGAFHVHVLRGAAAQVRCYGVVQEEVVEQHAAFGFIMFI